MVVNDSASIVPVQNLLEGSTPVLPRSGSGQAAFLPSIQFSSLHSLSRVRLFATP